MGKGKRKAKKAKLAEVNITLAGKLPSVGTAARFFAVVRALATLYGLELAGGYAEAEAGKWDEAHPQTRITAEDSNGPEGEPNSDFEPEPETE